MTEEIKTVELEVKAGGPGPESACELRLAGRRVGLLLPDGTTTIDPAACRGPSHAEAWAVSGWTLSPGEAWLLRLFLDHRHEAPPQPRGLRARLRAAVEVLLAP